MFYTHRPNTSPSLLSLSFFFFLSLFFLFFSLLFSFFPSFSCFSLSLSLPADFWCGDRRHATPLPTGLPPCKFLTDFQAFSHQKKSAFSAACQIQNYRNRKLQRPISQNHISRETAYKSYTQMIIHLKQYQLDFGIKLKLKVCFLLLTMPKTDFTQNISCSLFCGSASHMCNAPLIEMNHKHPGGEHEITLRYYIILYNH